MMNCCQVCAAAIQWIWEELQGSGAQHAALQNSLLLKATLHNSISCLCNHTSLTIWLYEISTLFCSFNMVYFSNEYFEILTYSHKLLCSISFITLVKKKLSIFMSTINHQPFVCFCRCLCCGWSKVLHRGEGQGLWSASPHDEYFQPIQATGL